MGGAGPAPRDAGRHLGTLRGAAPRVLVHSVDVKSSSRLHGLPSAALLSCAGALVASACLGSSGPDDEQQQDQEQDEEQEEHRKPTKEEICGTPYVPPEGSDAGAGSEDAAGAGAPDGVADLPSGQALLAINPNVNPFKVRIPEICVSEGETYSSVVRICVNAAGAVSQVTILQPSLPIIDEQLPTIIGRWQYNPYLVNGVPAPFCYPLRYTVQ
jgi:hypothetical protein